MNVSTLRTACAEGERPAILDEPQGASSRGDQTGVASVCLFFWLLVRYFVYCSSWSQNLLQSEGFNDDAALDQAIKKLEAGLKKARKKAANDGDEVTVSVHMIF